MIPHMVSATPPFGSTTPDLALDAGTPSAPTSAETPPTAQDQALPPPAPEGDEPDFLQPDPHDLPDVSRLKDDLRKGFKRLISERDQKVQGLQKEVEGLKEARQKAEAWDKLIANPEAAADIISAAQKAQSTSVSQAPLSLGIDAKSLIPRLSEKVTAAFQPEHLPDLAGLVLDIQEKTILQAAQPLVQAVQFLMAQVGQTEEQQVLKELPQAQPYLQQAKALAAQTGLPLRKALWAVSEGALAKAQQQGSAPPGRSGPASVPQSVPRDQVSRAIKQGLVDRDALAKELEEMYQRETGQPMSYMFR